MLTRPDRTKFDQINNGLVNIMREGRSEGCDGVGLPPLRLPVSPHKNELLRQLFCLTKGYIRNNMAYSAVLLKP